MCMLLHVSMCMATLSSHVCSKWLQRTIGDSSVCVCVGIWGVWQGLVGGWMQVRTGNVCFFTGTCGLFHVAGRVCVFGGAGEGIPCLCQ